MTKQRDNQSIFSNKIDIEDINVKVAIFYMLAMVALLLLFIIYLAFIKK